jgi:Ala-tRNA(Pro) deacylase
MAIAERLQQLLDEAAVHYVVRPHSEVFTAQEVAASTHVPGLHLAKVVVVRGPDHYGMLAVLPACCRVDLKALARVTGRERLTLVPEREFAPLFPDCQPGAMPPFGNLYGLPVYLDQCLRSREDLVFQAGNHHEVVRMRFADYEQLTQPVVAEFCLHEPREAAVPMAAGT